jgi:hypothetical protein
MKKLAITLSAVALLVSAIPKAFGTADSNETTISSKAKASFEKEFGAVENASWAKIDNTYIVTFDVNNAEVQAAYNEEGQLTGISKVIVKTSLPMAVYMAIEKKYPGYQVAKKGSEINYNNQTNYYFNVGNDAEILKLKCSADGSIEVESREKR